MRVRGCRQQPPLGLVQQSSLPMLKSGDQPDGSELSYFPPTRRLWDDRKTTLRPTMGERVHGHIPTPLMEHCGHAAGQFATRKPQKLTRYSVKPTDLPVASPGRFEEERMASSVLYKGSPAKGGRPCLGYHLAQHSCRQRSVVNVFGRDVSLNGQRRSLRADQIGPAVRLQHMVRHHLRLGSGFLGEPSNRLASSQAAPVMSDVPAQTFLPSSPSHFLADALTARRVISGPHFHCFALFRGRRPQVAA